MSIFSCSSRSQEAEKKKTAIKCYMTFQMNEESYQAQSKYLLW